jgi:putative flavoprotein involved in K+ transport
MTETAVQPAAAEVADWLGRFDRALQAGDATAAADLFALDGLWRDLVAVTWNVKTLEGPDEIRAMLEAQLPHIRPTGFAPTEPPTRTGETTEAWIGFETQTGRGSGHLRLRDGKAWTLLTSLDELKGHEEPVGYARPKGVEHGADPHRLTWLEMREREARELGHEVQPDVVIVGGGQAGIALGARLRQLGVPTIIVERNERAGDSWRKRYKSLCLHDPVWYDHMPYLKFPPNWPVFSPKDKIGDWLEMYTRVMELTYWSSTNAKSAAYDEAAGEWRVVVERDGAELTLRPKQLVMATGMSGKPNMPEIEGMDVFAGDQHHSSRHPGPDAYAGKRCVVIGSNNSSHDICAALWEAGAAEVTMVQRSSTHVVRSDTLMALMVDTYSEEAVAKGITTERADMMTAAMPYRLMADQQIPVYEGIHETDRDFYERLEATGFLHDWGDDGSGLIMKYLRRGSGYYIDVGASELLISGEIKLQIGTVDHLTEDAVVMSDGAVLPADLIVYATGYGSMNGWVADLISQEVADKVGKVWGLGSDTTKDPGPWEGEQRNMWKPTQQPDLWFHGGNLGQSRFHSLGLALQLKARVEGIDTPVYGLQEVHHLR